MHIMRTITLTGIVVLAVALLTAPVRTQAPDAAGLQQDIQKLQAGQDALRLQMQAMQKQLQEIRALLQAPPAPSAAAAAPLPAELDIAGAPSKGSASAACSPSPNTTAPIA